MNLLKILPVLSIFQPGSTGDKRDFFCKCCSQLTGAAGVLGTKSQNLSFMLLPLLSARKPGEGGNNKLGIGDVGRRMRLGSGKGSELEHEPMSGGGIGTKRQGAREGQACGRPGARAEESHH